MRDNKSKENLLSSWKDIAAFLDCHVRTCIRWEKQFGLPIHRMDASQKSRVFAYKDEIEQWQRECFKSENGYTRFYQKQRTWYKNPHIIYPGAILLAAVIFFSLLFAFPKAQQPYDFRIEKNRLIILSETGKKIWEYDTEIENLISEEEYRDRFQVKKRIDSRVVFLPLLIIKDINNDGKNETLFAPMSHDRFGVGNLICFDLKGNKKWSFQSGRQINSYTVEFSNDFSLCGFDIVDLNEDGEYEILVFADHRFYFPTQMSLLDTNGFSLGEYWNSGRLTDYALIDLNGDSQYELIISGMNNEYIKGMIAVFDPGNISGSSPQIQDEYRFKDIDSGMEKYYILFPRTDVDQVDHLRENISIIDILDNGRISTLAKNSNLLFEFDFDLHIQAIRASDSFRSAHKLLREQGKIDSELDDEYFERLKEGLLYFDGKQWVSQPAMRNPWD